jgi:hypothetical protein
MSRTIKTAYRKKIVPSSILDWTAWVDGEEEYFTATGPTEVAALNALTEMLQDDEDAENAQARRDDEQHYAEHGPGKR